MKPTLIAYQLPPASNMRPTEGSRWPFFLSQELKEGFKELLAQPLYLLFMIGYLPCFQPHEHYSVSYRAVICMCMGFASCHEGVIQLALAAFIITFGLVQLPWVHGRAIIRLQCLLRQFHAVSVK